MRDYYKDLKEPVIYIAKQYAFGSGTHETTYLALDMINQYSLNNDIKELNTLKPAIEDEYNKFNIAPEYRNAYAMQSLYDILSHRSTMSVADAMKKFDENERARMVAAAHREAGAKVANAVAEEAEKTRMTLDANSRKEQEINNAILGRLNDFYFYR